MDVCELEQALQKQSASEKTRLPLVPAENKNGVPPHSREVRSRYRSPSSPTGSNRCSSPIASRTSLASTVSSSAKRATSAERKRPSRSSSPRAPSTPIQDTTAELLLASKKVAGSKLPESLWPSTIRSLSVSFQSDTLSVPSKKEKQASHMPDRSLRQPSTVAHRQAGNPASGKPTPERKQSPRSRNNSADQSENSKPVDSLHPCLVDQHQWPSTTGKFSNAPDRSIDLADKKSKNSPLSCSVTATPSLRRLSLDGIAVSNRSVDLADKTSKTSSLSCSGIGTPSRRRLSLDGTASLTKSVDLTDKTIKTSSFPHSETGTTSLRRLSRDGTASPDRSIDLGDKATKALSLSYSGTGTPLKRISLDGNASLNRSTHLSDKTSKTSSSSHPKTGKPSPRGLFVDGNTVLSRNNDLIDKTSKTSSSSNLEKNTPSLRRLSLDKPVLNQSIDLDERTGKTSSKSHIVTGTPSPRTLSLDGTSKPLIKSTSDSLMLASRDTSGRALVNGCSVDDSSLQMRSPDSSSSSDRTQLVKAAARPLSIPTLGLFPLSSSVSRWASPSQAKSASSSRAPSPSRLRPSSPTRKIQSSAASVLSFIADIKLLKKASNHIEDVHHLRLLYNRFLQWRFANAQSDAALQSQKVKTEKMLCNVWMSISALWDSISEKRIEIQQLRLKLKLYSILDNQVFCLDEWALTETDHISSLTLAIQDLQASTIRVPVIRGARGDIETIKAAIGSAVDVMQAMGSSLCSILSKVDKTNCLVSELADAVIQESAMFDEYESLLGSITALQVEENSLRSHLLQLKQCWRDSEEASIFGY